MRIGISQKDKFIDLKVGAVIILREPYTGRIVYNSGRIYFNGKEQYKLFKKKLAREDRRLQVVRVFIKKAKPPSKFKIDEDTLKQELHLGKSFCPYCGSLELWYNEHCPVCGISKEDFWVKTFNGSWGSGLSNANKN